MEDRKEINRLLVEIEESEHLQHFLQEEIQSVNESTVRALGRPLLLLLLRAVKREDNWQISWLITCFGEQGLRGLLTPHFPSVGRKSMAALQKKMVVLFPELWETHPDCWRVVASAK
jgi:hypothetical protein